MKPLTLTALAAAAAFSLASAGPTSALAAKPPVYTAPLSKLAVGGYDVTTYFSGAPSKGDPRWTATRGGVDYRFTSAANLAAFKAHPDAYLPQYGGYCAWAVAHGYTAKGDPEAWTVVGGRLYLNYDAGIRAKWSADIPGYVAKADKNWPQVLK